jgi:transposase
VDARPVLWHKTDDIDKDRIETKNALREFLCLNKLRTGSFKLFNLLSPELNPICYLLALLAHDFLHVTRIRVKSLTLRLLILYIYIHDRSPTEIVGSNPTEGMDICLL